MLKLNLIDMYKKLYESEERRRKRNNKSKKYNDIDDSLPEFDSYDDYIEYTKTDKYKKNRDKQNNYSVTYNKKPIKKEYKELDYTMDGSVKQLFLNLTKMTTTFDKENTLQQFLPKNIEVDDHGNYFINIGDSKSMFCCHLDVYCKEYKRVYHIIEGNIISSDGTTVLGGDDKAGMVVMLKMIENNVPGLYYFFRGEEGTTSPSGTWGSKNALKSYKDIFKTYNRCIAFDRRGFKSIISRMMYNDCCSDEFVTALSSEFKKYGMEYETDKTGVWTDSGVFMETIPECTNISVGYLSEHTFNETQDIKHLEDLCNAAIKIDWEKLPTKRDPSIVPVGVGNYKYDWDFEWDSSYYNRKKRKSSAVTYSKNSFKSAEDIFEDIQDLLLSIGYECLNDHDFDEAEEMYFSSFNTNDFFAIRIINSEIYMSDEYVKIYTCYGSFEDFKKYVRTETGLSDDIDDETANARVIIPDVLQKEKIETFKKIVLRYPTISTLIVKHLKNSKTAEIPNELWYKLEKIMSETMKLKMDYSGEEGYSVDDFVEWAYKNLDKLSNDLKIKDKKQGLFSSYLDDTSDYTDEQTEIFSKLIQNDRELVKLVLKDIDIQKSPKVRESTSDKIIESLKKYNINSKEGLKNINPQTFCLFIFDFTESINKFYDDLPF